MGSSANLSYSQAERNQRAEVVNSPTDVVELEPARKIFADVMPNAITPDPPAFHHKAFIDTTFQRKIIRYYKEPILDEWRKLGLDAVRTLKMAV